MDGPDETTLNHCACVRMRTARTRTHLRTRARCSACSSPPPSASSRDCKSHPEPLKPQQEHVTVWAQAANSPAILQKTVQRAMTQRSCTEPQCQRSRKPEITKGAAPEPHSPVRRTKRCVEKATFPPTMLIVIGAKLGAPLHQVNGRRTELPIFLDPLPQLGRQTVIHV